MPITFSDLFRDEAFEVRNRRDLKAFYELVKETVKRGDLTLEGHTLPTTMNEWIRQLEDDKILPKREQDVVDFSLAEDEAFKKWKKAYLGELRKARLASQTVYVNQAAKDLVESVQTVSDANARSLEMTNNKKEDVLAALSDLQGAVYMFLNSYDGARAKLKLPDRTLPLEVFKVRQAKKQKTKHE